MWGEFKSLNDPGKKKKKNQNGKLGMVEGTETECDIWDKHFQ